MKKRSKIKCTCTPSYLLAIQYVDLIPEPTKTKDFFISVVDTETGEILAESLPGISQRETLAEFCYSYGWLVDEKLSELFDPEEKN